MKRFGPPLNFLLDLFHSEVPSAFCAAVSSVGRPWQGRDMRHSHIVLAAQTTDQASMGVYLPIHHQHAASPAINVTRRRETADRQTEERGHI